MASNNNLTINIAPLSFSSNKIRAGWVEYTDEEQYQNLRDSNRDTHIFRYDNRDNRIYNLSLFPSIEPIGSIEELDLDNHLLLVAKAVQRGILNWLANKNPIIKSGNKQLVFWGQQSHAQLLTQATNKLNLPSITGVEVLLRYSIDCRMFWGTDNLPYLGLVLDVGTANIIDLPVSNLISKGLDVVGLYVFERYDTEYDYLHSTLKPLGQVSGISGERLLLTDSTGEDTVKANEVFLEPRTENLESVIKVLVGLKSTSVISELKRLRQPISSSLGKLSHIHQTIDILNKRKLKVAGNVEIKVEPLLEEGSKLFFAPITTERPTLLFGGQGRNVKEIPDYGIRTWGPYMYMQHTRNTPLIGIIYEPELKGRVEQFVRSLLEGFPDEMWTDENSPNPFRGGLVSKFRLNKPRIEYEEASSSSAEAYRQAGQRLLERLAELPDLVLVQIRDNFKKLPSKVNPYLVTKSPVICDREGRYEGK